MFIEFGGDLLFDLAAVCLLCEAHFLYYLAVKVVGCWQERTFLRSWHK